MRTFCNISLCSFDPHRLPTGTPSSPPMIRIQIRVPLYFNLMLQNIYAKERLLHRLLKCVPVRRVRSERCQRF